MSPSRDAYPTSAFDFELPPDRIAQYPHERRDESRLLVLDRATGRIAHRRFRDLLDLIPAGDALVLNETRVFPARLLGRRAGGGHAEVLLLHPVAGGGEAGGRWEALVRPGSKLKAGKRVHVSDELDVEIEDVLPSGNRVVRLLTNLPEDEALERYGRIPLPPYVEREPSTEDAERYQTVFARERGSVAAPTAGLHFTRELLDALERKGVRLVRLILHVGIGTFRPVEVEDPAEHPMHAERYSVSREAADALNAVRRAGGAIWAVGTTVTRTLETVTDDDGVVHPGAGETALFIRPPYRFKAVDRLITNFHLPRSTLLMLVSAFGGHENVMRAYRVAIDEGYRFFSYGDAMVVA